MTARRSISFPAARGRPPLQRSPLPDRAPPPRGDGPRAASRGFTLIEVLIVVAIIGILGAIAYPSYGDYVRKTRRSDAHVALLEQRQTFERCRALRYSYANCSLSRTTSPEGFYTLSLSPTPTATAFTIVATATGAQTSDTDCRKLTIDQRDQTLAYDKDDASSTDCW